MEINENGSTRTVAMTAFIDFINSWRTELRNVLISVGIIACQGIRLWTVLCNR